MSKVDGLISVELGTQLQQLSVLAHESKKSEENIEKLKEISQKTLSDIEKEIDNLNIISQNYLDEIRDLINDENWNALPSVSQVRADLQQIKSMLYAITDSLKFISIDIEGIMREIMKMQGIAMQHFADEKAIAKKFQIEFGKNEIMAKKEANQKQLTADLVSAGFKIGVGAFQSISGVGNLKSAIKASKISNDASDLSKALNDQTIKRADAESMISLQSSPLEKFKNAVDKLGGLKNLSAEKKVSFDNKVSIINDKHNKLTGPGGGLDSAKATGKVADANSAKIMSEIETLNTQAKTMTELNGANNAIVGAIGSAAMGFGDAIAGVYKYLSGEDEIQAEFSKQAGGLASSVEQGNIDSYQQIRNSINDLKQMLSAMEQALSSSISAMMRL